MINALRLAGFPGVEAEGRIIHARLWSSSIEFTATPEADVWRLSVQWPVRATHAQMADWNMTHPETVMDIHLGETRVSMRVTESDADALVLWAALAEQAVAHCIRWRRVQRAPGEGM